MLAERWGVPASLCVRVGVCVCVFGCVCVHVRVCVCVLDSITLRDLKDQRFRFSSNVVHSSL